MDRDPAAFLVQFASWVGGKEDCWVADRLSEPEGFEGPGTVDVDVALGGGPAGGADIEFIEAEDNAAEDDAAEDDGPEDGVALVDKALMTSPE